MLMMNDKQSGYAFGGEAVGSFSSDARVCPFNDRLLVLQ